jgi:hypothetical protein
MTRTSTSLLLSTFNGIIVRETRTNNTNYGPFVKNQVTIYCGDFVGLDLNSVHGQENNGFRGASSFVRST